MTGLGQLYLRSIALLLWSTVYVAEVFIHVDFLLKCEQSTQSCKNVSVPDYKSGSLPIIYSCFLLSVSLRFAYCTCKWSTVSSCDWLICMCFGRSIHASSCVCLVCAKWCTVQTYKCTFCSATTPGGLAPINHWTAELKYNNTVRWQQWWCTYKLTYCPASTLCGLTPTNHWTTELKCNDTG